MPAPVIDMWAPILPVPEVMCYTADNFPDAMLGYLRVFYKTEPTQDAFRARAGAIATPLDDVLAALDAAGIARTLIAGADELRGKAAVAELEHWIRERRFRGLSLRPFMIGLPADDRHCYPFYAKCVELGVPLSIHTSANWTTTAVNDLGHPRHIDVVARDFPELK